MVVEVVAGLKAVLKEVGIMFGVVNLIKEVGAMEVFTLAIKNINIIYKT